jgi:TRAP-type C4-dicarboxylate transport system substrate-binding protein
MDGGARSVYTNKAIAEPADLKGYKFRMMGNPIFVDTMNAMGGNGISMSYGEVFTALQTGVIDGAENNPPSLFTSNHYTTDANHYSLTRHLIIPELFVMSKVTWNKLSPEQQTLVRKLSKEATAEQRVSWDKSVAEYNVKLKAAGVQYHEANYDAFFEATQSVREKYGKDYADLLARIKAVK